MGGQSAEVTKSDLTKKLIELGIFQESDKIDNLTQVQMESIISSFEALQNESKKSIETLEKLNEEKVVDQICKSKKVDEKFQEKFKNEVVRRRKSEQYVQSFKNQIKTQAEALIKLLS